MPCRSGTYARAGTCSTASQLVMGVDRGGGDGGADRDSGGLSPEGVAHRDLKPDNVFFDGEGRLRLADFGSAERFGDDRLMKGMVGTPFYVTPEVLTGREYCEKVDVWSAGVLLYIMLSEIPPFFGETTAEIFEGVLRGNLQFPTRVFDGVLSSSKDIVRRMQRWMLPTRVFDGILSLLHP